MWNASGIWELKVPPALKQAEMLAPHSVQKRNVEYEEGTPHYTERYCNTREYRCSIYSLISRRVGGAAPVCHDWNLEKWEAKYLLDTALSTNSESVKVSVLGNIRSLMVCIARGK